jgi:3-phytase
MFRFIYALFISLALNACAGTKTTIDKEPDELAEKEPLLSEQKIAYQTIQESFLTALTPADNIDSPASWHAPDGTTWLLATAKATDLLVLYDGDTGKTMKSVGGSGAAAGQFRRPNGIFVIDNFVFVVERDNQRVQILSLPSLTSLGSFGADLLISPYGLWVNRSSGGYDVIVSDAYMSPANEDVPPPLGQLDKRFKRFRVDLSDGLTAKHVGNFGDTDAEGAILIPESVWGDAFNRQILLSEENQSTGTFLKVYGLDFKYSGQTVGKGLFKAQAEGITLWQCPDNTGYWITTDQYKDRSVFHVFERIGFAYVGSFAGSTTANTDGVWLHQTGTALFPMGVFYAVHDDQGVAAFDWRDIAKALSLPMTCKS